VRQGADFTPRDRERIAELLNQQNGLTVRYDANRVRASQANYLVVKNARGTVQGCVGVARTTTNGMVADLHHLSVDSSVQRQGYGMRLLQAAEARAQELGCQVVQTTVRADNDASRALLQRAGYTRSSTFRNPASGNTLEVWHRPLGAARPADVSPPPAASAPASQGESWWQEQLARLIRQGHSEEEARRMLVGLLRRMGRPLPAGAA
jgi:ribosomal protein S18 acetylase RimI-like enzyme